MFFGEFTHTFDDKGRLTLPAKYREVLLSGVVITRGIDRCLFVFPRADFVPVAQNIASLPFTDPNNRDFGRLMFSQAADLTPDKQGRVLIPQGLRNYADLNGEAIIIGLFNKLEIWNPSKWAEVQTRVEADPQSTVMKLHTATSELGL
jgi:MraZ protein